MNKNSKIYIAGHRDYRDSGSSIIKIFDERIEFFNPGKLYDDITIEKLNVGVNFGVNVGVNEVFAFSKMDTEVLNMIERLN
jgi:predicted HTH transcriptional regulator